MGGRDVEILLKTDQNIVNFCVIAIERHSGLKYLRAADEFYRLFNVNKR